MEQDEKIKALELEVQELKRSLGWIRATLFILALCMLRLW